MKTKYFPLLLGMIILLIGLVSAYEVFGEKLIKDDEYNKITLYKNWGKEGPVVITNKKVISQIIDRINSSPREKLSNITFEQRPDGRMIFEDKSNVYEVRVFSHSGNVVTNTHLINTAFKLNEIVE
jgi:hypothetical protein